MSGRRGLSIFCRGIPFDAQQDDFRLEFERYGPIRDVYIPLDYHTGRPRGFAYVQFEDDRDAEDAMYEMRGRARISDTQVQLEYAKGDRKTRHEMRRGDDESRSPRRRRGSGDRFRRARSDDRHSRGRRSESGDERRRSRSEERFVSRSRSRSRSPRRSLRESPISRSPLPISSEAPSSSSNNPSSTN